MESKRNLISLTLIAWLAMLGFDFFLHGGLLSGVYLRSDPFLLPPERAFALIPVGFLSFLLLAILLVWLTTRMGLTGWRAGAVFGLELGGLAWGALVLGLYSISTASPAVLFAWFVGQTVELGIAGAVVGSGRSGTAIRRLFWIVFIFALVMVLITIVLQSIGLAPTITARGTG
jgi:hypothetical protein